LQKSGATTADIFKIFTRNAASAAAVLTQQAGPAWAAFRTEMQNTGGAADKMAATLQSGIQGQLENLTGSVETAAIVLGTALKPAFEALVKAGTVVVNWVIDAIKWFTALPGWVQAAAGTFVAFAASIGPVTLAIGGLIQLITMLGPAFGTMATAIGLTSTQALGPFIGKVGILITLVGALGAALKANANEIGIAVGGIIIPLLEKQKAVFEDLAKILPGAFGQKFAAAAKGLGAAIAEQTHAVNEQYAAIEKRK